MHPAVPEPLPNGDDPGRSGPDDAVGFDVGAFEQGSEFSRWALARYIVGRVILERVSWALLVVAGVLLVLAGLCEWGLHTTFVAVVLVLLALGVLAMRGLLRAVLRRLMNAAAYGPLEDRVGDIVNGARAGVFAEMRRVGLPSRILTLPLLILRFLGRRRAETMQRVRRFDVERAVPKASRDELYLVLSQAIGRRR